MIFFKNLIFAVAMIGAINWGVIGIFDFNLISYACGAESYLCRIIYCIIGACGVFSATYAVIDCQCYCELQHKKNNNKNRSS